MSSHVQRRARGKPYGHKVSEAEKKVRDEKRQLDGLVAGLFASTNQGADKIDAGRLLTDI